MRPLLRRRRWWLFGAVSLATLSIAATFLVFDLKRSAAFDRVQVGMKSIHAHRILMDAGAMDLESGLDWESLNHDKYAFRLATYYRLGDDLIKIVWDRDDHVFGKDRWTFRPSWEDRVLAWLAPVRAALRL
jgi:hypothetical protein